MNKVVLSVGALAVFAASITLSWADRLDYGSNLDGIVSGQAARASDVRGAFNAIKSAIDCPSDMVEVGPICVDKYEASVWNTAGDTQYGKAADMDNYPGACANNTGNGCSAKINNGAANPDAIYAKSLANQEPSRYISWFQAQQACANVGKRLLTNAEWQMAAAGTPDDTTCQINAKGNTGALSTCVSNWGAYDMVGNVHEWVADWIQGNTSVWNPTGDAATTNAAYGSDFMSGVNPASSLVGNGQNMPAAIFRGGDAAGTSAGVFAFTAIAQPSHSGGALGFRCAR